MTKRVRRRPSQTPGDATRVQQLPNRPVVNRFPPTCAISDDEVEYIHHASLQILEQVGVEIMSAEGRQLLLENGAKQLSDGHVICIQRELVDECLQSVRSTFPMHARNPTHDLEVGSDRILFGTVGSAPHASDLDHGRRAGNLHDYRKFLKLAQQLNIVHFISGYPVEPVDVHPSIRHLECLRDGVLLSDKVIHAYSLGRERNLDGIRIVQIARQLTDEQLLEQPSLFTVINSNSPLRLDANMVTGIIEMARFNQVVILTPFTLSGAMAPVTLAGAIAQQNAEVLAGLTLSQLTRPGAPFVYGGFTSNVDMRSGAPAFGTPEYMKAALISGQMARRYGLPFRSSNTNAANAVDAQSAYESVFSLWGAIQGHAQIVLHAAGWMEGGLTASFEKFVLDADLLQMIAEFLLPIPINDDEVGIESMIEAGHGGHFFGTRHTKRRYRSAFYTPLLSDWRNYETWCEAGSPQTFQHANRLYKQLLTEYEPPPIDPAVREQLDDYVDRRIREGGVKTDF